MLPQILVRKCTPNIALSGLGRYSIRTKKKDDSEEGPSIVTDIPGPKSIALIKKLQELQNVGNVEFFANYKCSNDNYLVDVDGNKLLDLNMQQGSIPLGYNNLELIQNLSQESLIANPISTHIFPCDCWETRMRNIMEKVSANLPRITTVSSPSSSIEYPMKAMMMAYKQKTRCEEKPSRRELECALNNRPPGSPLLSILSFKHGYHGETLGVLSATRSRILSKLDVTAFDWPMANFPKYRYPLDQHCCYNTNQDRKCLAMVEDLIVQWKKRGQDVVGIVVEPIQGDTVTTASSKFFHDLQDCAKRHNIYFMFDESQTGCGSTGKFWCHEHFKLPCPPDVISFSRKSLISGYLHSEELSPKDPSRISSVWMGDPMRLVMFETVINAICKYNLLENVCKTGDYLKQGLLKLEQEYDGIIGSTRGMGTFLAVDAKCPALRNDLLCRLRKKGILCGKCGVNGISLRPALTFNVGHANIFLEKLRCVLKETEVIEPPEVLKCTFPTIKKKCQPKITRKKSCEKLVEQAKSECPSSQPSSIIEQQFVGNKKDPCKAKEDPCKKKEDPCKKKEDPCKKKDEDPCKKKEDPCKKKDEDQCKKKEDPCKKKDEDPCKKKEDPCKKKDEDPCKKKEDPCKKKDEDPCKKKEDPCKKKEDPCKKKEDPCKKKEDPCKKKEGPSKKKCSGKSDIDLCVEEDPYKLEALWEQKCTGKHDDACKKKDPCKKDPCKKEDPCKKKKEKDPCKGKKCDNVCNNRSNVEEGSVNVHTLCRKECTSKDDDACKKKDPCKKDPCKKEDPCKKKKKKDPCKGKGKKCASNSNDPCKKKEDPCKKKDPCADKSKATYVSNPPCPAPCHNWNIDKDPCKKKEEDPCKKKDPCEKKCSGGAGDIKVEDPCKKKNDSSKQQCSSGSGDPCKKKDDPCKKKEDRCKKKEDPCKKKDDPCKKKDPCEKKCSGKSSSDHCKKEDPCKKKDDPCKRKDDPCKKDKCGDKANDPCKKKSCDHKRKGYFDALRMKGKEACKRILEKRRNTETSGEKQCEK